MKKTKQLGSLNFVDLESIAREYIDWAVDSYTYDGLAFAHIALGRQYYLREVKKPQHIRQLGLLWDIALWIHSGDYRYHPKETFFELLKAARISAPPEEELGVFVLYDNKLQDGEAQAYTQKAVDEIGFYPILKKRCCFLFLDLVILPRDEEEREQDRNA